MDLETQFYKMVEWSNQIVQELEPYIRKMREEIKVLWKKN